MQSKLAKSGLRKSSHKQEQHTYSLLLLTPSHYSEMPPRPPPKKNAPQLRLWAKCGALTVTSLFLELSWQSSWIWAWGLANLEHCILLTDM